MDDHNHIFESGSKESRLARICRMSVPQLRAFSPMRIPYEDLEKLCFDDAEVVFEAGFCTPEEWQRYCYDFRNKAFKISDLGRIMAKQYARANNLPLPLSDRPLHD